MSGGGLGCAKGGYRADIDGLRAVAVLVVIANHVDRSWAPGGHLGVDVFFVISGFVITASVMRTKSENFLDFASSFYQRRIKRLAPAPLLCILATSIALALLDEFALDAFRTGAAAAFGVSNIYLAFERVEYFSSDAAMNAFLHTWSLGVEEQFYLFFPLFFWLIWGRDQAAPRRRYFFGLIAVGSVASFALFAALSQSHPSFAHFLPATRAWELGAGALAYAACRSDRRAAAALRRAPPIAPLIALFALFAAPPTSAALSTLAAVMGTAALIIALQDRASERAAPTFAFLTMKPMTFLGLISYSLYLWHWPVLVIGRLTFDVSPQTAPFLLAIILALAVLSYFLVERPLRYASWTGSGRRIISGGLFASFICAASVMGLASIHRHLNLANLLGYPTAHIGVTWAIDRYADAYLEDCHVKRDYDPALLETCLSRGRGAPAVFLIGDSHARNYAPTLRAAFPERQLRYLTMGYGCAFLPEALARAHNGVNCVAYGRDVRTHLANAVRPGDVVAFGQRLQGLPERLNDAYLGFVDEAAAAFIAEGARVIVFDGTFAPAAHPRFCLDLPWRPTRSGCETTAAASRNAFAAFDAAVGDLAARREGLWYAPLRLGLCDRGACGQRTAGGAPVWHDIGHITDASARELAPLLRRRLRRDGFFGGDPDAPLVADVRAQGSD